MTGTWLDDIIEQQGWNNETVCQLLAQFLIEQKQLDACGEYFRKVAEEENAEGGG